MKLGFQTKIRFAAIYKFCVNFKIGKALLTNSKNGSVSYSFIATPRSSSSPSLKCVQYHYNAPRAYFDMCILHC